MPDGMEVRLLSVSGFSNAAKTQKYHQALSQQLAQEHFDLIVGFNKMPGLDLYFAADSCFAYKAFKERGWFF